MTSRKNIAGRILKQVVIFIISLFILSILVFCISRMTPTDPLQSYYGERVEKMSVEDKLKAREKLGLNDAINVQYVRWLENAFHGDFGISYKYKQDVLEVIRLRLPNTLLLGGTGFVLVFIGALLLGSLCAWYENRWIDKVICKIGTLVSCIPEFWLSLVLIFIFSVVLRWLPGSGAYSVGQDKNIVDRLVHLILPLIVVVTGHLWYYAYMVRNKLIEEIRMDYVTLARVKGLKGAKILFGHCLRCVMPSYLSMMAISVPHILGGTYIVEMIFSYPGIGTLAYESARYADYNMLMVICLMTGAVVMLCSMFAQMLNAWIDPRMQSGEVQI